MPARRTRTLSTKVTEAEYDRCTALAGERRISDWLRETVVEVSDPESTNHALLAELLALRKILLNLHFAIATDTPVTRDLMAQLIAEGDADKGSKARARLHGR